MYAVTVGGEDDDASQERQLAVATPECETLAKYWVSETFSAEHISNDGVAWTTHNHSATLTITSSSYRRVHDHGGHWQRRLYVLGPRRQYR